MVKGNPLALGEFPKGGYPFFNGFMPVPIGLCKDQNTEVFPVLDIIHFSLLGRTGWKKKQGSRDRRQEFVKIIHDLVISEFLAPGTAGIVWGWCRIFS